MDTWTIVCITGTVTLSAILWMRERKRQAALRELAARRGFSYLGQSLPRSFTLRGTELERVTSIWNVIDGDCGGIRVISFDCRVGTGKSSWRHTAVAAQGPPDVFGTTFSLDLTVDRCGEWSIMYEPRKLFSSGLMSVADVESHFDSICRLIGDFRLKGAKSGCRTKDLPPTRLQSRCTTA